MTRPTIDPALGLDLVAERTLEPIADPLVTVMIPAHNEEATVADVVRAAQASLDVLAVRGEILVSASGCTDSTANRAEKAGAVVVDAPVGKGAAIKAGLAETHGDIVCLVDGDIEYFGDRGLVEILVAPIVSGIADATISDLYWRPLYPQLWLSAFWAPVAGRLFPEMLPKCGSTPWSGQRAAIRSLWPAEMPDHFTVDLSLLLHWNENALRLRPVLADDWRNPQRPKPDLMAAELQLLTEAAVKDGRISEGQVPAFHEWYERAHSLMAEYDSEQDDPTRFEHAALRRSLALLPG